MKKLFVMLMVILLIAPLASARAHGEETSSKLDLSFLGGDNDKTENVTTTAEETQDELTSTEETEEVEVVKIEINETNSTEVEEAQEIIKEIESSKPIANENSSAKKQLYIFTTDVELLENNIEPIVLVKKFDDGIVAIVPESEFKTLDELELKYMTVEDYRKYLLAQSIVINDAYQSRNVNRERMELTYGEVQEAEEEAKDKMEELGLSDPNPYAYYFLETDALPDVSTTSAAYAKAASIIYMSDKDLWEQDEKWISPNFVFDVTPGMSDNPTGEPVSDCEEHAMTFVALCREAGVKASDVRVVTGYVNINNEKYGHAWAQVKIQDEWIDIETTSGSYVEDGKIYTVEPINMYFYKDVTYPAVEIWSYFNDDYYVNANGGNAPDDWVISETNYNAGTTDTSFSGFLLYCYDYIRKELYKIL